MIVFSRKNVFLSLILFAFCAAAWGQNDPYRAEIGVQTGLNLYYGDINKAVEFVHTSNTPLGNLKNLQPDFGVTFRYRFNQRFALRGGYDYTKVKGKYSYWDANQSYSAQLNNPLHLMDIWGEFNFFDLENNPYKRFSKRFSPFIFAGIGGVVMPDYKSTETNSNFTFTIPYGVGFKWKMGGRWNLNVLYINRHLLGDNLEGKSEFDNPFPKTVSNPLNHDALTGLSIGITYDFWVRDCDCNTTSFSKGKKPAQQKEVRQKKVSNKRTK